MVSPPSWFQRHVHPCVVQLHFKSRNITIFIQAASDLGLSGAHEQLVVSYLTSSRRQRSQSLKTIEATFKDFKESRLNEDTYTRELHAQILLRSSMQASLIMKWGVTCSKMQRICADSLFLMTIIIIKESPRDCLPWGHMIIEDALCT